MASKDGPSDCLSLETLDRFVDGGSGEQRIKQHVQGCGKCRDEVDRIERNAAFLARLPKAETRASVVASGSSGQPQIAGYEIIEEIHRGGQGIVYKAVQEATKRTVALKVLLQGALSTSRQRRRFEREVELVALFQHSNIVTIHESGLTADGRHYFAMEYIEGATLDCYVRTELAARSNGKPAAAGEVVRLFGRICNAVSYAHQRGVIHRDLKPANILIDSEGRPHILDFGLAKATDDRLAGTAASLTRTGEFMGTLAYASPEQVSGDPDQVDVRSDVYSLGVVLYELLTGHSPYPVTGRVDEIVRAIAEAPPQPPRSWHRRCSRSGVGAIDGDPVPYRVDDEMETIVLKALAKEKDRRYQSAEHLGRDIEHYLAGEPIDAKRDSGWYTLRKAVRRHKALVAVAATFVLLVTAFAVTMAVQAHMIADERDRALLAESSATQTARFMANIFRLFDPDRVGGAANIAARDMLDQGAERIDELEDPASQAKVMDAIGSGYQVLGLYEDAGPLLENALATRRRIFGGNHLDVAHSLNQLAALRQAQGDYAGAEGLLREALETLRRQPDQQEPMAAVLTALCGVLVDMGRYAAAEEAVREALSIQRRLGSDERPSFAWSVNNLAWVLQNKGDFGEAERYYRQALAMRRNLYGDEHQDVALSMGNLAGVLALREQFADAEDLYRQALAIRRKLQGNMHPDVATSLHYLGWVLIEVGDYPRADPLIREALAIRRQALPPNHADIGRTLLLLGQNLLARGEPAAAEPLLRESLQVCRIVWPGGHWLTAHVQSVLGECLTDMRRFDEAEPFLLQSYPILSEARGESDERTRGALGRIIDLYQAWGKPDPAAEWRAKLSAEDRDG